MASGLGSRNMAMVSRSPKTLLWLLIMFYCKTMRMSKLFQKNAASCTVVSAGSKYTMVARIFESIWLIHEPFSTQKETASCAWKQKEKHEGRICKAMKYIEYAQLQGEKIQQISSSLKCRPVKTVFKLDAMLVINCCCPLYPAKCSCLWQNELESVVKSSLNKQQFANCFRA